MGTHQHTADDVNPAKLRACADLLENPIVSHEPVLHSIVGRIRTCADELDTISRANAELRALMLALLDTGTAYTEWLETGPNFQGTVDARKAYLAACVAAHTKLTTTEAKK